MKKNDTDSNKVNVASSKNKERESVLRLERAGAIFNVARVEKKYHSFHSFILDTGVTLHIVSSYKDVLNFKPHIIKVGTLKSGKGVYSKGYGSLLLRLDNGKTVLVNNVYVCPDANSNILSGKRLTESGFTLVFSKKYLEIQYKGVSYYNCSKQDNLLYIRADILNKNDALRLRNNSKKSIASVAIDAELLHMRMGNLNNNRLKSLQNVTQNKLEAKNHTENHFYKKCIS
eukprot:snap_masked-scaffold_24-processed-gene-5.43-mRNA-1 protein AED:1.00 eAED:1.00 QI:0/-1/0/0/-1/1/1/0/229